MPAATDAISVMVSSGISCGGTDGGKNGGLKSCGGGTMPSPAASVIVALARPCSTSTLARPDSMPLISNGSGPVLSCTASATLGTTRGDAEVDRKPDTQPALHENVEPLAADCDLHDPGPGERRYDPAEGILLAAQTGDETDIEWRQRNVKAHVDGDIGDLSGAERQRRQRKGVAHREMTLREADLETGFFPARQEERDLLDIGEDRLQRAENAFITDVDVGDRRRVLRIGFHVREDADERLVVVLNREAYAGQKKRPAQRGIRIRIDRDRRHRWLCYG